MKSPNFQESPIKHTTAGEMPDPETELRRRIIADSVILTNYGKTILFPLAVLTLGAAAYFSYRAFKDKSSEVG